MMKLAVGMITLLVLMWGMHRSTSLVAPPSHSRWGRKWHLAIAISLFIAALTILTVALLIDCRYLCHGWQSNVLDIIAAFAAFLMGMILERWIDPKTLSPSDWRNLAVGLAIVLVIEFALVQFLQPGPAWRALPILALAFALPILGIASKIFWPRLFGDRCNRC